MLDYLIGLLMTGFGFWSHPINVLGEQVARQASVSGTTRSLAQLRLMRPKFTAAEQEAFQQERAKREANLRIMSASRVREYARAFEDKARIRKEKDQAAKQVLEAKTQEFHDSQKKQKLLTLADSFQSTVTGMLSSMQEKLESMIVLLDRINAASGALKSQGVDVHQVEVDISDAQTHINTAVSLVSSLVESLPTIFSVSSEDGAKTEVLEAIANVKIQVEPVRAAFTQAHQAVDRALSSLERLTDAVQVGLWPVR